MFDIDKDWIPVIITAIPFAAAGIGWYAKNRRADRLAKEKARDDRELAHLKKIEELQNKISSDQQARIADEANKRREADVSNQLLKDMTVLLKKAIAAKSDAKDK